MSKFCVKCGARLSDDALFCTNCGEKTKSDDGINTKVGFYGYDDDGVPIPLKALAREYGTSRGERKKPFMRKAFKDTSAITDAMNRVQERYIRDE